MAFVSSINTGILDYWGTKRFQSGTYTNTDGSTGGDIVTGFSTVDAFWLQPLGSAIKASAPVVNETFPLNNVNGTVTIVTNADEVGQWFALGL